MTEIDNSQLLNKKKEKKHKHRCFLCNTKIQVAMRGYPCQCQNEFCLLHRLPENHECTFNRREEHLKTCQSKISELKCVSEKMERI